MSDESLRLGQKWLEIQRAAGKATMAADDMHVVLQRMENDQSEAFWNIAKTKMGILLSAADNVGSIACDVLEGTTAKQIGRLCSLAKDIIKTVKGAGECNMGSVKDCVGAALSYEKALARVWADKGVRVISGLEAVALMQQEGFSFDLVVAGCEAADIKKLQEILGGCSVVALAKNAREAWEVRALKGQLDVIFRNNIRIAYAALQRVEQQAKELERQADDARAAYQAQREKDEAAEAERIKREQEEISQAKKDSEEKERAKRQQAEMEQARISAESAAQQQGSGGSTARNDGERAGRNSPQSGGRASSSDGDLQMSGGKGGGGSFDITVWNYGDPVPGVERPPEFDKPKRKNPCHFKDTNCLEPFAEGAVTPSQDNPPAAQNPWSQEIEREITGGLLSSEQIRQEIEQKVRGGLSSSRKSAQQPCDENLGCPDDESGAKGPGKDLLAKLDADLDRIKSNQPGAAGGTLPGSTLDAGEGGSSFDTLAALRSLRSGLGVYRQGREAFSNLRGSPGMSLGGNCPNKIPYPPEAISIVQRRGQQLPPMPTVDAMIQQAGGADSAASALRQQIQAQEQALAQWPAGLEEEVRRLTELTVGHNRQILQAVECRRGNSLSSPVPPRPIQSAPRESVRAQEPRVPSVGGGSKCVHTATRTCSTQ